MHVKYAPGDLVDVQAHELRPTVPSSTGAQLQCVGCIVHAHQNYISEPNQRGQQGTSSEGEGVALKLPDCSNEITSVGTAPPIFLLSAAEDTMHHQSPHLYLSDQETMKAAKRQTVLKS